MKTKNCPRAARSYFVYFVCFVVSLLSLHASTNDLSSILQTGLFEEEANHNLGAAIQAYQSVAAQFDKDRKLAATAIFRLGECYRKQGATNEAAAQYQRILRDFSEQTTLVTLSRENLTSFGARPVQSASEATAREDAASADAEAIALAIQIQRLSSLQREPLRVTIQQEYPNPVLTSLMQRRTESEQKLIGLEGNYGPQSAEILNAKAQLEALEKQIDAQVDGVLRNLKDQQEAARMKAQALASLKTQNKAQETGGSETQGATSDEAEEVRRIQAMIKDSPDLINAKDSQTGKTPLQKAASQGQLVVAQFLLQNGADVEAKGQQGRTALHEAGSGGHRAMVELLLSHGAQVDDTDSGGRTPLHLAAQHGFRSVAEVLLAKGASINAARSSGITPLSEAVANGSTAVAELLLSHGATNNAAASMQPLHLAAQRGDLPMTELLLSNHPNVNLEDSKGRTPLSYAAEAQSAPVIKALLAAHADPNAGRVDLPISYAAYCGDLPSLELLLTNSANPKVATAMDFWSQGTFTPLFVAISLNHPETVQELLRAGADPNELTRWGSASDPIIFSVLSRTNLLEVLLAGSANPNQSNHEGTPLLNEAINHGGSYATEEAGRKALVEILLAHGASVAVTNREGITPLHLAASLGKTNIIEVLLKHGADINARNSGGSTPLIWAVSGGQNSAVEFLLQHGADPNIRNDSGNTALDLAKNRNPNPVGFYQGTFPPGALPATPYASHKPGAVMPVSPPGLMGVPGSTPVSSTPPSMADLLREHGAIENLPHLDRIDLQRSSTGFYETAFRKNTNDWSRFTLLELLAIQYQFLAESPSDGSSRQSYGRLTFIEQFYRLPFPDFAHVKVRRPRTDSKHWQEQPVDLNPLFESGDCSKDVPLSWGDVVEVPEADHPLGERWKGFSIANLWNLKKCLTRHVQIIVKSQATTITLAPGILSALENQQWMNTVPGAGTIGGGEPFILPRTPFWLRPVLLESKLVLASSDLSRVKVTRNDPKTGKKREWVVDCRVSSPVPDLWLSDGDVIEVPDRE
jgi:ankyrin repeat protein